MQMNQKIKANVIRRFLPLIGVGFMSMSVNATSALEAELERVAPKVIEWRRHIHQNPELSNREFKTAEKVAAHLTTLGMEVETGLAHTGVVGLLRGGKPGPTVMLRADMDALPVTEDNDLSFKSTVTTEYRGVKTGVMHACGHDTHVAMLMGAAQVLAAKRQALKGNVLFVFQPAEEGAPPGEEGGAELFLKQGLFKKYQPEAAFGLHITSAMHTGQIGYRSGPIMASADRFEMQILGKQAHGSRPWTGVDPIVTAAQIINGVQTIVSRQVNITKEPAVVTFGKISGGVRNNIIPDKVTMVGTIRNFDMGIRQQIFEKLTTTAEKIAESQGALAKVQIFEGYPVTVNNKELVDKMLSTVQKAAGKDKVIEVPKITGAEDFSFYALEIPAMFMFLGATPEDKSLVGIPSNHSPLVYYDEAAFKTGTATLSNLAWDYLMQD